MKKLNVFFFLMQDGATIHTADYSINDLKGRV
jgi:hypothetical protein